MGLKDQLNQEYIAAMKSKDERTVSVVRLLKTAIKNQEISVGRGLSEEEMHVVVRRLIKQTQDARADFERGGRVDLVSQAEAEIAKLEQYVPSQMSDEEIVKYIDDALNMTGVGARPDIGKIMGAVMKQIAGRAEGNRVRTLVVKRMSA